MFSCVAKRWDCYVRYKVRQQEVICKSEFKKTSDTIGAKHVTNKPYHQTT